MVYPGGTHKYLTFTGRLWRLVPGGETWTFGFRLTPSGSTDVTQAQVNAADAAFRTRWSSTVSASGAFISNNHSYTNCKLASISADGKYTPGTISFESTAVDLAGTRTGIADWPGQCAIAATLLTAKPGARGYASKGRIFLPASPSSLNTDGRLTPSEATRLATFTAMLISDLNTVPNLGTVSVFSKVGAGLAWNVSQVRVGTVVDTIRSRRRQLPENPPAPVTVP